MVSSENQSGGKLEAFSRMLCGAACSFDLGLMKIILLKVEDFCRDYWRGILPERSLARRSLALSIRVIKRSMRHGYFNNRAMTLLYRELRKREHYLSTLALNPNG